MISKACIICGNVFIAVNNSKTCGKPCSEEAAKRRSARPRRYRDCIICGKTFRLLSGNATTCGPDCSRERKRAYERARSATKTTSGGHTWESKKTSQCVICGCVFTLRGNSKTCLSEECKVTQKRNTKKRSTMRNKEKQRAAYLRWVSNPKNKEKLREARRRYELRKAERMSDDERFRLEEKKKRRQYETERRLRRNADKAAAVAHRRRVAESNRRKRLQMTEEDVEEYRKKKREEQRRYRADPVKHAKLNARKRAYRQKQNKEQFAGCVLKAMSILTNIERESGHECGND